MEDETRMAALAVAGALNRADHTALTEDITAAPRPGAVTLPASIAGEWYDVTVTPAHQAAKNAANAPDGQFRANVAEGKIEAALGLIRHYGAIEGDTHRAWLISQIHAALTGGTPFAAGRQDAP